MSSSLPKDIAVISFAAAGLMSIPQPTKAEPAQATASGSTTFVRPSGIAGGTSYEALIDASLVNNLLVTQQGPSINGTLLQPVQTATVLVNNGKAFLLNSDQAKLLTAARENNTILETFAVLKPTLGQLGNIITNSDDLDPRLTAIIGSNIPIAVPEAVTRQLLEAFLNSGDEIYTPLTAAQSKAEINKQITEQIKAITNSFNTAAITAGKGSLVPADTTSVLYKTPKEMERLDPAVFNYLKRNAKNGGAGLE